MKPNKKALLKVLSVGILAGIIAIILTDVFFFLIFPSAWLFFFIPAFMGFFITKFCTFPNEILHDETEFNRMSKRLGILIAIICLSAVLLAIVPLLLFESDIFVHLISNFLFYIICGVAIFIGYNRGVEIVTDAYYDSLE